LRSFVGFALLVACAPVPAVFGQPSRSIDPETVVVPSGKLRLRLPLETRGRCSL